jgi:hypothetical protein
MAEGRRGSAGTAVEGLDLELHLGLPSTRIALDLDLNVDLSLFAGPREGLFGFDGWSWPKRRDRNLSQYTRSILVAVFKPVISYHS